MKRASASTSVDSEALAIRRLRRVARVTLEELGGETGITPTTIYVIETGIRKPRKQEITAFRDAILRISERRVAESESDAANAFAFFREGGEGFRRWFVSVRRKFHVSVSEIAKSTGEKASAIYANPQTKHISEVTRICKRRLDAISSEMDISPRTD